MQGGIFRRIDGVHLTAQWFTGDKESAAVPIKPDLKRFEEFEQAQLSSKYLLILEHMVPLKERGGEIEE